MASAVPRTASAARTLLVRSNRLPVAASRAAFLPIAQRRGASGGFHYDPAPPQIETVLKENHAEPHTAEEWSEIGRSALRTCKTQGEVEAVREYIGQAIKPKLSEDEIIAVSSQAGVALTTPEEVAAAQLVFKKIMASATLAEVQVLFNHYEKTGEFPKDISIALQESLTKSLEAPAVAGAGDHGDFGAHEHPPAGHGHGAEHAKESIGLGFWLTIGAIPFSYILYTLSKSKTTDDKPFFTRWIHKYDSWREEWALRNELHTKSVEQAGFDRLLFSHAATAEGSGYGKRVMKHVDGMNQGPPINVAPGRYVNLDKVVEHYEKRNQELEEERLAAEKWRRENPHPGSTMTSKGLFLS